MYGFMAKKDVESSILMHVVIRCQVFVHDGSANRRLFFWTLKTVPACCHCCPLLKELIVPLDATSSVFVPAEYMKSSNNTEICHSSAFSHALIALL